jgi:cytochrome c1
MATYAQGVTSDEFEAWLVSMREPAAAAADLPASETGAAATPPAAVSSAVGPALQAQQDTTGAAVQETLEQQGQRLFLSKACIACHAIAGTTARGVVGPNLTRFGSRPSVGAGALPNTQENVERWILAPQQVKAGTLMPGAVDAAAGFPPTGLTPDEVRAVSAYLVSLK